MCSRVMTVLSVAGVLIFSVVTPSYAASQDECSIWLCLPGGFPSGCGGAKSAMIDRIKHRKSPLPDWSECSKSGDQPNTNLRYREGYAAYIPRHRECLRIESHSSGCSGSGHNGGGSCSRWETCTEWSNTIYPQKYVKNIFCSMGRGRHKEEWNNRPAYCTKTSRYREVLVDGKVVGEPYYIN